VSPDGRWLLAFDFATGVATLVERTTSVQDVFQLFPFQIPDFQWRPGHDELWFSTGHAPDQPPKLTTSIKKPGEPVVEVPGTPFGNGEPDDDSIPRSYFTRDGAYWFTSRDTPSGRPIVQVGSADDPTGDRFDLGPPGAISYEYWRLADGRLLVPVWTGIGGRNDVYAVDPATGDTRLLAGEAAVMAVGQTRLLASLHVDESRGDLAAVELASGRTTVLAPEFTVAAFVERQGEDGVAPGAPVVYHFQARFDSPFDGIWMATVP
jgi:hypothetical protein